ncbi:hypothetical protein ABZP36_018423 [Zizania latifolia]
MAMAVTEARGAPPRPPDGRKLVAAVASHLALIFRRKNAGVGAGVGWREVKPRRVLYGGVVANGATLLFGRNLSPSAFPKEASPLEHMVKNITCQEMLPYHHAYWLELLWSYPCV